MSSEAESSVTLRMVESLCETLKFCLLLAAGVAALALASPASVQRALGIFTGCSL